MIFQIHFLLLYLNDWSTKGTFELKSRIAILICQIRTRQIIRQWDIWFMQAMHGKKLSFMKLQILQHVSCLIPYGYVSYLRQSWSTFTHWGQVLIYYWLGLSRVKHSFAIVIFCKLFAWLAWLIALHCALPLPDVAFSELVSLNQDCGPLFSTCIWVHDNTSPIVF